MSVDTYRRLAPPPPTLDASQRLAGYTKSLATRQARAELKKDLKAGKLQLREVLGTDRKSGPWDWVSGMKVLDLLRALPTVANKRAAKMIQVAGINPANTVGRCSPQQLMRLCAQVEKRYDPQKNSAKF